MTQKPKITTIRNENGLEAQISNLGATLINLMVPDKNKNLVNVVVGLATPEDYYASEDGNTDSDLKNPEGD